MPKSPHPIRKIARRSVKLALFVSGALTSVKTAFDFVSKGNLKSLGLVTTLDIKVFLDNLGHLTGVFIVRFSLLTFALCVGIPLCLGVAAILILVPLRICLTACSRFSSAMRNVDIAILNGFEQVERFADRNEDLVQLLMAVLVGFCLFVSAWVNVRWLFVKTNNPFAEHSLRHGKVDVIFTCIGLIVLCWGYLLAYRSIVMFIKESEKDETDSASV